MTDFSYSPFIHFEWNSSLSVLFQPRIMRWRPCTRRHTSGVAGVVLLDSTTISNYLHRIVQVKQVTGQIDIRHMTQSIIIFLHVRVLPFWIVRHKCLSHIYLSNKNRINLKKVVMNISFSLALNQLSYSSCHIIIIDYPHYLDIWLRKDKLHITIIC